MEISIGDIAALANMSQRLGTGPVGLAGNIGGLSATEQSQLPRWAWWAAGTILVAGGVVLLARTLARHH